MAAYSNACLIQLNSHCWDCANKVRAVLDRLYGASNVFVDSSSDTVKVTGNVDPQAVLSAVKPYDIHARILWAKPTPVYPYGYSSADQYWGNYSQPLQHPGQNWCNYSQPPQQPGQNCCNYGQPLHRASGYYKQPSCGSQYHPRCNIM